MTKNVGGIMDYARLANFHRPIDPAVLQQEVRRLASEQGLTATDIATALRLNLVQVREVLAASQDVRS